MTREVDLVSYLPPFLAEFKEIAVTLEAENPEFVLVWNAAERVFQNEFIETADEYGISRFEKMMGLLPDDEDSLESRRARVMSKWLGKLPYTLKMLIKNLTVLCGGSDFKITSNFNGYTIKITTHLRFYSQIQELNELLERMVPANMVIESFNSVGLAVNGVAKIYTGIKTVGTHKKRKVEIKNYGLE